MWSIPQFFEDDGDDTVDTLEVFLVNSAGVVRASVVCARPSALSDTDKVPDNKQLIVSLLIVSSLRAQR